jgi:hypothetical protein
MLEAEAVNLFLLPVGALTSNKLVTLDKSEFYKPSDVK